MDELTIGNKTYISSKRAAEVTGYAKDYIGQLCREGRVNATLVGRSWYVLESSLRAHRFGAAESAENTLKDEVIEPVSTWNVPIYKTEEPTPVPPLTPRKSVNVLDNDPVAPKEEISEPETIQDMQTAWKEWFADRAKHQVKQEEISVDEVVEEGPQAVVEKIEEGPITEEPYEDSEPDFEPANVSYVQDEEAEPVQIHKTQSTSPIVEENVHIRREYISAPVPVVQPIIQEGIIRNEVIKKRQKEQTYRSQRKGSSLAFKALLVSVAGLAVVVAAIGSGATDELIEREGLNNSVTRFITGTTVLDK